MRKPIKNMLWAQIHAPIEIKFDNNKTKWSEKIWLMIWETASHRVRMTLARDRAYRKLYEY